MKTRLTRIGNSWVVCLTQCILDEAGLTDEIEIYAQAGAVIIRPAATVRAGWKESIERFGSTSLLDEPSNTQFDKNEWN